jgi:hypothetical protein
MNTITIRRSGGDCLVILMPKLGSGNLSLRAAIKNLMEKININGIIHIMVINSVALDKAEKIAR